MSVYRIYVEKQSDYAHLAIGVKYEIRHVLQIKNVTDVRVVNRYDVEGIDQALFEKCIPIVFSEPQVDKISFDCPKGDFHIIASEYLPGQFDACAASCEECIELISEGIRPLVRTARLFLLEGTPTEQEIERIKQYLINPVESKETTLETKTTLKQNYADPEDVPILTGFINMSQEELQTVDNTWGLAMDLDDLRCCQNYFKTENRDPSFTEIRMIDTYWSDHCRHTTFLTQIDNLDIEKVEVEKAFKRYLSIKEEVASHKPVTLMDMATIGTKILKKQGRLPELDESEEINACSIEIDVDINGKKEPWLLMFKNETHNHPTEIEPFGGAATCIGGAIRDPLSGRSYVYQAMRVTGAANPLLPVQETLKGKLPQRKLVTTAAQGYSAYGNQIGLATGLVDELYHDDYVAKRLEIGAVVGAVPKKNVRRECPEPGDVVILLGGRTGRDGCGGATGSSKSHNLDSLETCGAEVQKGNPVVERKLQRLFRNEKVARCIKRCNDFGAGGISVAIGELADGLTIQLDAVPKKYEGLDGTALAISESQERMAVVVEAKDSEEFIALAHAENVEATLVATVTEERRLRMTWQGKLIVDLDRDFLNTNGAEKHTECKVENSSLKTISFAGNNFSEQMESLVGDLNICSKKGLAERFDSTIGAGSVLMPFGGKYQMTKTQSMVAKIPVLEGETNTVSAMSYGFHPELMAQSPYEGAYLSVVESIARLAACGVSTKQAYLTFQEYFKRMTKDATRWGQPVSALLGALSAQLDLGVAAIGGKDSMSGTFEDIDVPPTLVSFAVSTGNSKDIISPEFKKAGSTLCALCVDGLDGVAFKENTAKLFNYIKEKKVVSAWAIGLGGIAEGVFNMSLGNKIGAELNTNLPLFGQNIGSFVLEMAEGEVLGEVIGKTVSEYTLTANGESVSLNSLQDIFEGKLAKVFPYFEDGETVEAPSFESKTWAKPSIITNKPLVYVPCFPGTNCEIDTLRALERAGAKVEIGLVNNLTPSHIKESVSAAKNMIDRAQMIVLPGGFSAGDEPDGSAKFITAFFRNPAITESVRQLLQKRDGLMLGICNGFQALIKLGLVPFGDIVDTDDTCPTLTFNTIGRHQSMLVTTRIASNKSPWLMHTNVGDEHLIAISHGEGRFVANESTLQNLIANGQVATQYVNQQGVPTMDLRYNPNGSLLAIEGITSPDGRVFGKMGHSERIGEDLYKNVPGNRFQMLFESGVNYFKG